MQRLGTAFMPNAAAATDRYRIGIDVGGTFTDVVLVRENTGEILVAKVPTVPFDPSEGCVAGFDKAVGLHGIAPDALSFLVHGTTIATNTIIQGKGAKAGLITSEGFSDVLEIAYQTRPSLYDAFYDKPAPLVPRRLCVGVPERIGPAGETIIELDTGAVKAAAATLLSEGVEAIVVAFLHSYRDPANEQRAREAILAEHPDAEVILSSDVCPEFREYPRTSTAVVNGVLVPRVSPYLSRLEDKLRSRKVQAGLHLMTSSGGIVAAETAKRFPVTLVESGPAAGVIGATFVAGLSGYRNLLALDIGGTTAKAAIVTDGEPQISDQFEVGAQAVAGVTGNRGQGYPVRTPVISLVEIGAGGGSIAYVDLGGALAVGPESAGAVPGPASYGQGGTEPTITDCNIALGRVNPDFFLGGEKALDPLLAEAAIRTRIAEPLGISVQEAADAVLEIANTKMTSALYFVSVEQGIDPRDYILVASGGAGPMQAVTIARQLGVRSVLIPPTPGLNSAVGLLATDLRHEQVRTYMRPADEADAEELLSVLDEMAAGLAGLLRREGVAEQRISVSRQLDMCYVGQSYALRVPLPDSGHGGALVEAARSAFHDAHRAAYGYSNPGEAIQIVSLRVISVGKVERPRLREVGAADGPASAAVKQVRPVYFTESGGTTPTAIYDRTLLRSGHRFEGPAVVEQMDTTVVVPPGTSVGVDNFGNLIISTGAQ
jgi:N-methylhydantoinase A